MSPRLVRHTVAILLVLALANLAASFYELHTARAVHEQTCIVKQVPAKP